MSKEIKPKIVSVSAARDELEREFNVRVRCFPRWIDDGRLSQTDAQDRLDRLFTACGVLGEEVEKEEKQQMLKDCLGDIATAGSQVTSTGDMTKASN